MNLQSWPRRPSAIHDCGRHGKLTARQMAIAAGCSTRTIRRRLEDLTPQQAVEYVRPKPKRVTSVYRDAHARQGTMTIAVAIRVARAYPRRMPTVAQLQTDFGMCRATAYRWRAAFIDAMGQPG